MKKMSFPKFHDANDLGTASNYFRNSCWSSGPVRQCFYVYLTGRFQRLAAGNDQQGQTPAGRDQGAAATARGSALLRVRRSLSLFASGAGQPVEQIPSDMLLAVNRITMDSFVRNDVRPATDDADRPAPLVATADFS